MTVGTATSEQVKRTTTTKTVVQESHTSPQSVEKMIGDVLSGVNEACRMPGVLPSFFLGQISLESTGKTKAVSPKGATGLMQLMPDTAVGVAEKLLGDPSSVNKDPVYGSFSLTKDDKADLQKLRRMKETFKNRDQFLKEVKTFLKNNPKLNVLMGIAYLHEQYWVFDKRFPEIDNILKFNLALAAYNYGPRHVNEKLKIHGLNHVFSHLPSETKKYVANLSQLKKSTENVRAEIAAQKRDFAGWSEQKMPLDH